MAMKGYSTFLKYPGLEPQHYLQYRIIYIESLLCWSYPSSDMKLVYYTAPLTWFIFIFKIKNSAIQNLIILSTSWCFYVHFRSNTFEKDILSSYSLINGLKSITALLQQGYLGINLKPNQQPGFDLSHFFFFLYVSILCYINLRGLLSIKVNLTSRPLSGIFTLKPRGLSHSCSFNLIVCNLGSKRDYKWDMSVFRTRCRILSNLRQIVAMISFLDSRSNYSFENRCYENNKVKFTHNV